MVFNALFLKNKINSKIHYEQMWKFYIKMGSMLREKTCVSESAYLCCVLFINKKHNSRILEAYLRRCWLIVLLQSWWGSTWALLLKSHRDSEQAGGLQMAVSERELESVAESVQVKSCYRDTWPWNPNALQQQGLIWGSDHMSITDRLLDVFFTACSRQNQPRTCCSHGRGKR